MMSFGDDEWDDDLPDAEEIVYTQKGDPANTETLSDAVDDITDVREDETVDLPLSEPESGNRLDLSDDS